MYVFELFVMYMILYDGNRQFMNMKRMQAFQLHAKLEVHEKLVCFSETRRGHEGKKICSNTKRTICLS